MTEPTYEDFKNKIDIKDLLVDAGYHFYRKDGTRYPVFVKLDHNGKRIHGDKFIVTANGLCCFRPPEQRNYNVISFIKEFSDKFSEYTPGMDKNRLVNLVCKRLLNHPIEQTWQEIKESREESVFNVEKYDLLAYDKNNKENVKRFYPFFRQRGLDLWTQAAFSGHFFISTSKSQQGEYRYSNLAFPFQVPGNDAIVGLEERGVRRKDGNSYKGKASGTNSVSGVWIANLSGKPFDKAERVYWFESGYDAMSFHQIQRKNGGEYKGVYVSTGGSPGEKQFSGVLELCPNAEHHLCFDRDLPGKIYACNFVMQRAGRRFSSYSMPGSSTIVFVDKTEGQVRHEFEKDTFSFSTFCERMGVHDKRNVYHPAAQWYKDWNDQLLEKRIEQVMQEKQLLASRLNTESFEKSEGKEATENSITEEPEKTEEKHSVRFRR